MIKEYELCFEQLRFYDKRQANLVKFVLTLTSSIATALFAVSQVKDVSPIFFWKSLFAVTSIVFIATLVVYVALLQNRLYFVFVARQINAIRKYFLEHECQQFKENQMYLSTKIRASSLLSIHSAMLLGVTLISSLYAAVTFYALLHIINCPQPIPVFLGLVVVVLVSVAEIGIGHLFLFYQGKQPAAGAGLTST